MIEQKLSRQKFVHAPGDLHRDIEKSCRDIFFFLGFMCAARRDIKELCRDKLFLVKSNVSTNFVMTERKYVVIEIPTTELRFDFCLSR